MAAGLDHRPGRTWRPLLDTTVAAQLLYNSPAEWFAWRRAVDFYDEGVMIWLEADTIIRAQTQGRRSLDDFIRKFHGGQSGPPEVKPYTFDDLVTAINEAAPYDWRGFFNTRLNFTGPRAPLGGLQASGWKIDYNDTPNEFLRLAEAANRQVNLSFSLGLVLKSDGTVLDVINGQAAERAGLAPGMRLAAVNGRRFSQAGIVAALKAAEPMELLMENGEFFRSYRVDYRGGLRYPHLVREEARPDLLTEIWKPKT
jgi:predicted metalloprotease with PDZ domain